jgi:hypothetical protein
MRYACLAARSLRANAACSAGIFFFFSFLLCVLFLFLFLFWFLLWSVLLTIAGMASLQEHPGGLKYINIRQATRGEGRTIGGRGMNLGIPGLLDGPLVSVFPCLSSLLVAFADDTRSIRLLRTRTSFPNHRFHP